MSKIDLIHAEVAKVPTDKLDEVYGLVKGFSAGKKRKRKASFMSRLKRIKINAPVDFATNLDLYLFGEKRAENLH